MNAAPPSLADARSLVASPLWPRIRAFLWDFASLCDPARLSAAADETSGTGGFAALANALATTPRVAASALHALGVEATFHPFPATDSSRLLLLSREDYDRLAQFLGVIALAPALRRVTAGAEVRALKAALPDYRETLAYAAYFHRFEALFKQVAPADAAATAETVCAAGHALLAAALSDLPPELLRRQRLRFPAGSPADSALAREAGSVPEASASGAAARLALKLSNPQEYQQCFS